MKADIELEVIAFGDAMRKEGASEWELRLGEDGMFMSVDATTRFKGWLTARRAHPAPQGQAEPVLGQARVRMPGHEWFEIPPGIIDHYSKNGYETRGLFLAATAQPTPAPLTNDQRVDDLAALVGRLVRALKKAAPEHELPAQAMDYLKRKDLLGSPLRIESRTQQVVDAPTPWQDRMQTHYAQGNVLANPASFFMGQELADWRSRGVVDAQDGERLDWLEQMANEPEGLLLHDGGDFTGRLGLGLRRVGRTLRQACDAVMKAREAS